MTPQNRTLNVLQWNCRSIKEKKHFLINFLIDHDIQVFALQETWLKDEDDFRIDGFDLVRKDGPNGYRGVMLGVRNDISYTEILKVRTTSGELVGAEVLTNLGQKVNIICAYCAPNWGLNTREVGAALAGACHPKLVMGDFNTHSQSWGCELEDSRARTVSEMFDELGLVHLNDGSHTRLAAPPRRSSAIDLTLCSAALALGEYTWTVLEDAAGSDHLPIVTSFESFTIDDRMAIPIFDLTRHISWSAYSESVLVSLHDLSANGDIGERYDAFLEIMRHSAMESQTRFSEMYRVNPMKRAIWWDDECDHLRDAKLDAFRQFRADGSSENYEAYKVSERILNHACRSKKTESWRRYCSTMTYETRLTDI
jgi:exonuclease III